MAEPSLDRMLRHEVRAASTPWHRRVRLTSATAMTFDVIASQRVARTRAHDRLREAIREQRRKPGLRRNDGEGFPPTPPRHCAREQSSDTRRMDRIDGH
jgi:hypothetical protein